MTRRPVVAAFDATGSSGTFGTPAPSRHARHWPLTLAFAAVAMAFTGCVSLAPEYEQPPLPVPQTFPESGTPSNGANTLSAVQVGWKDYFTDPVLQGLIAEALDYNKDLQLAIQRVEEARAMYGIRRADQFPTIGVEADLARARVPAQLSGYGVPVTASQYQVGIGLASWELDFWGRVANLKEAALQNYLATDAARQAVTLTVVEQVANSYLSLRELDERITLTQQTIASRKESYRIFTRRHEVGAISRLDLKQVETLWRQAEALGAQLQQERATRVNALQLLVGKPIDMPHIDVKLDDHAVMRDLPPGLPSDLLTNRPDIVAAEFQLRGANANIGAARAEFFPKITLTGAFGTASTQLSDLFTGPSRAWNFGPSVSLPIFDMGRRESNLEVAKSQRDQAVTSYERAVQSAFRDVADALAAREWLAEQVETLRATEAAQAERARLAQLRYDHGASPFLEVLDAQRDLLAVQQQLVQTRRAYLSSRVSLYAALGGGGFATSAPGVMGSESDTNGATVSPGATHAISPEIAAPGTGTPSAKPAPKASRAPAAAPHTP
ncbi:efflux transporter outer membrane subunit [Paraburkholderia tropica]|uniref:Multidrug efflux system outer membrane protein n=2 Tax=Paraburkholderia tropica TaxID=92647 RepID=A0ABX5MG66_9BURK|nr:multidrug efflux system outer membrane protein [Paraburkholderia tropica]PXX06142.1 multidrug efflux system outer membrane protein [Paraburkholderia tropica]PZW71953.1 multidrug efflux system outer membrane protein [Paraburkholderia tropica]